MNNATNGAGLTMAKKGAFERLLGGLISSSKKTPRQEPEEPELYSMGRKVEDQAPRVKKEPGMLDPLMAVLSSDEKFLLISSCMDFVGDFLVKMLDQYNFELTKVENAISSFQSTVLNHVRLIRNQVNIARQQGVFKEQQPAPAFSLPPGASIAKIASSTSADDGLEKKRQPTERDIMDIAASIRTLVTRQKLAKSPDEEVPVTPAASVLASSGSSVPSTTESIPGMSSLDSKIEQFQKHGDEQKQRIEKMSTASHPASGKKPKQPGAKKASKKAAQQKPGAKPAAKQAASKKAPKPPAKKAAPVPVEKAPPKKLDKERDMLPEGFQAELMKNIKGLMKDKEKGQKKT